MMFSRREGHPAIALPNTRFRGIFEEVKGLAGKVVLSQTLKQKPTGDSAGEANCESWRTKASRDVGLIDSGGR